MGGEVFFEDNPDRKMLGISELVVGPGKVGKTGGCLLMVKKAKPEKLLIIAPRITHKNFYDFRQIDWPVMNADELVEAFNDDEKERPFDGKLLVIVSPRLEKGQPPIWEILQDPYFRDFYIYADEIAILNKLPVMENAFDDFIRTVGQNNQHFLGCTHRIVDDLSRVAPLQVDKIYVVGQLSDEREMKGLYGVSNLRGKMTFDEFSAKLMAQPECFNWWSDHPNWSTFFLIYS